MILRSDFLKSLDNINSTININNAIVNLETFIDSELTNNINIIKFINSISATSGLITTVDGLEIVNKFIPTNMVHKDSTVVSNNRITIKDGIDNLSYAIWSNTLTYPNNINASLNPQLDATIAEQNINLINGYLRITCPTNTNKFVANMLATKYNTSGFWNNIVYPNDKNNKVHNNSYDTVRTLYDKTTNTVFIEFKLI